MRKADEISQELKENSTQGQWLAIRLPLDGQTDLLICITRECARLINELFWSEWCKAKKKDSWVMPIDMENLGGFKFGYIPHECAVPENLSLYDNCPEILFPIESILNLNLCTYPGICNIEANYSEIFLDFHISDFIDSYTFQYSFSNILAKFRENFPQMPFLPAESEKLFTELCNKSLNPEGNLPSQIESKNDGCSLTYTLYTPVNTSRDEWLNKVGCPNNEYTSDGGWNQFKIAKYYYASALLWYFNDGFGREQNCELQADVQELQAFLSNTAYNDPNGERLRAQTAISLIGKLSEDAQAQVWSNVRKLYNNPFYSILKVYLVLSPIGKKEMGCDCECLFLENGSVHKGVKKLSDLEGIIKKTLSMVFPDNKNLQ